ncbi:hypothetical protein EBZ39_03695 [bacterium]|nr:hypothetical protein [bacterium]
MSKVKAVEIDGEIYHVRKVRAGEYFACEFNDASARDNCLKLLSIGLSNEDGTRKFPANEHGQVTAESTSFIEDLPAVDCLLLAKEVTDFNGFSDLEKK